MSLFCAVAVVTACASAGRSHGPLWAPDKAVAPPPPPPLSLTSQRRTPAHSAASDDSSAANATFLHFPGGWLRGGVTLTAGNPSCPPATCYAAPGLRVGPAPNGALNASRLLPGFERTTRFACGADSACDAFVFTQPTLVSFARGAAAASGGSEGEKAEAGGSRNGGVSWSGDSAVPAGDLWVSASTCGDPAKFAPPVAVPAADGAGAYPYCSDTCSAGGGAASFEYQYCPCYAYAVIKTINTTTLGDAQTACAASADCAALDTDYESQPSPSPSPPSPPPPSTPVSVARLYACAGGGHGANFPAEGVYFKRPSPPPAAPSVTDARVDFATPIDGPGGRTFLGVGGVMHGFDYMQESTNRGWNDTFANVSLGRIRASRLRVARTWYGPDWTMATWGAPLNFTTPRFEQFCRWLADMKSAGVTVAMQAGWWSPANTCTLGTPGDGCVPDPAVDLPIYARWMSESVREIVVNRGFDNVRILVAFTEPLDYDSGKFPPRFNRTTYYVAAVQALHQGLVAAGLRHLVKIQGPNSAPTAADVAFARAELGVAGAIDVYSGHTYSLPSYAAWFKAYSAAIDPVRGDAGKLFVVDEGGDSDEAFRYTAAYGTFLGLMHAAAVNAGASTTTLWLYRDQYYVWPLQDANGHDSFYHGLHKWGLEPWLPDSLDVRPAWYAVSAMMEHVGPPAGANATRAVVASGHVGTVAVAAVGGGDGAASCHRAVLLVNEGGAPASVRVALAGVATPPSCGGGSGAVTLRRFAYDPAQAPTDNRPIAAGRSVDLTGADGVIDDALPVGAVVVWATS